MVENKKIINAKKIAKFFGLGTDFYKKSSKFLKTQAELKKKFTGGKLSNLFFLNILTTSLY